MQATRVGVEPRSRSRLKNDTLALSVTLPTMINDKKKHKTLDLFSKNEKKFLMLTIGDQRHVTSSRRRFSKPQSSTSPSLY